MYEGHLQQGTIANAAVAIVMATYSSSLHSTSAYPTQHVSEIEVNSCNHIFIRCTETHTHVHTHRHMQLNTIQTDLRPHTCFPH